MARTPRKVVVQPPNPLLDKKNILNTTRKLRVTYYARVSTGKDEQENSYEAQNDYYTNKIKSHPNWLFVPGYADHGISGTNTFKRDEFNRMIKDCKEGKIDIILTKSISRFARNTVDTLITVRDLQRIGVSVIFEKENINSATQDCEMLLTIFGSIAQEESRSISENVKWALRAKFERGEIMLCTNRFWGLDRDENGDLVINKEQARVVRLIAMLYLSGMSCEDIARDLDRRGIKTITGKDKWCASTVRSILKNEKYGGYAIQGKTYTDDFLTKHRVKNRGEMPKYKVISGIPAILPISVVVRIQEEMAKRAISNHPDVGGEHSGKTKHSKYALSDLLRCSDCGNTFRRVNWKLGGKNIPVYRCKNTQIKGQICPNSPALRESDIERSVIIAMNEMKKQDTDSRVSSILLNNIKAVIEKDEVVDTAVLDEQMKDVKQKMSELIEQGMNGFEEDPEVDLKLIEQANLLKQLQFARKQIVENQRNHNRIESIEEHVNDSVMNIKQFDNALMRKMIERINVNEDASIDIHFKFGAIVHKQLERAKAR